MNHLERIAEKLSAYEIDAMMVSSTPGEFYSLGFRGEGVLLVSKNACRYFTDARYIEAAQKKVHGCEISVSPVAKEHIPLINKAIEELGIRRLGYEDGYMSVRDYLRYTREVRCELVPCQPLMTELRAAKDEREIALMQKSQDVVDEAFLVILDYIRPGMTERDISAKLLYEMFKRGARFSFNPIVVTGVNTSLPHGIPSDAQIQPGQFLTMDFGCVVDGYCSDMTRTVAIGEPSEEMRTVYNTVLQAQLAGIAASRAGVTGKSIDTAARKVIEEAGYGPYFSHGYGHSLGVEGKETPLANTVDETPMPVGAAVSAEPGIYLPGRFGVRIEDVVIMTETGCLNLTKSPKDLIVL